MNAYLKSSKIYPGIARLDGSRSLLRYLSVGVAFVSCLFLLSPLNAQMKEGMKMEKGMKMEMATEGIFEGKGKVIAIVPEKGQIVLEHEEIKGFMKAMTMGYPVETKALMKGFKPGDAIKFKIDAAKKKIIAMERLEK